MHRLNTFLAAACISLLFIVGGLFHALKQYPPYAPNVEPNQQSERGLHDIRESEREDRPAIVTPAPGIGSKVREPPRSGEPDNSEEGTEFWPLIYGYRLKITDTLIAGFTALLFWATWLLWRATKRLVSGADNTSENQLRAYVSMRGKFVQAFDDQTRCIVQYDIENTGQTPAHHFSHHGDVLIAPHPLPEDFAFPNLSNPLTNPFVLFPRLPMQGKQVATSVFSKTEIAEVVAGRARIYMYGEVFYEDIFRKQDRVTKFAISVVADRATLEKLTTNYRPSDLKLSFETAPIGNTAT